VCVPSCNIKSLLHAGYYLISISQYQVKYYFLREHPSDLLLDGRLDDKCTIYMIKNLTKNILPSEKDSLLGIKKSAYYELDDIKLKNQEKIAASEDEFDNSSGYGLLIIASSTFVFSVI
jgi:hypothetical protein